VHPRQHGFAFGPTAFDQCQVDALRCLVLERVRHEFTGRRAQGTATHVFHQRFNPATVVDQISDGADFETMLGRKNLQVWQARHGAVVFHDLANHGSWQTTRHRRQIAAGLGVPGAHQDTAFDRLQREHMARLNQILGFGIFGNGGLNGTRPVSGRDAGGDAFGGLY
jgi:hypothetical protein